MDTPIKSLVTLGRAIGDARRSLGLTQAQVADATGLVQPTVSNVERGASNVPAETLLRILAALQLELVLRDRGQRDPRTPWEGGV